MIIARLKKFNTMLMDGFQRNKNVNMYPRACVEIFCIILLPKIPNGHIHAGFSLLDKELL